MLWPPGHFIHQKHKSCTVELIGVQWYHHPSPLRLQPWSCSQTWCHLDLQQNDMHRELNFGSTWEADLTVGILSSQGMDTMLMDLWISVVQARRLDTSRDTVGILQGMEKEITPKSHLLLSQWYAHWSQDRQTHPDVATFLATRDVCCLLLITLLIVENQILKRRRQQEYIENSKYPLKFSCLRSDIKDQCQRWWRLHALITLLIKSRKWLRMGCRR